jgi:DNA mismatch repair protein MutS2
MRVAAADVEEVLPQAQGPARPPSIRFTQGPEFAVSVREINLIGRRAEEACETVDKFLDTAALAQAERVRIVHGHGMGILRKAIGELLGRNPHVAKFYAAGPEEGGTGATIVELK